MDALSNHDRIDAARQWVNAMAAAMDDQEQARFLLVVLYCWQNGLPVSDAQERFLREGEE